MTIIRIVLESIVKMLLFTGLAGIVVVSLIYLFTSPAEGGDCRIRQRFVSHHVSHGYGHAFAVKHYAAPFVAYWSVGSALREEAIAERAAQKALEQFQLQLQQQGNPTLSQSAAGINPTEHFPQLAKNGCVKCHNAEKASGGINLDVDSIDEYTAFLAMKAIAEGQMPPGGPLADDVRAAYKTAAEGLRSQLLEALK